MRRKARQFWGGLQQSVPMALQAFMQQKYRQDIVEQRREEAKEREERAKRQEETRAKELAEKSRLERGRVHRAAGAQRRGQQTVENLLGMEYGEEGATAIEEFKGAAPERELFPGMKIPMVGAAGIQIPRVTEPDLTGMENLSGILQRSRTSREREEGIERTRLRDVIRGKETATRETAAATAEAQSLEELIEHERAAFTQLQQTYPDVYGEREFNPRAAEKGQYTQALKELSVAEARPQSSDLLARLLGFGGGGGGVTPPPDADNTGGAGLTTEEIQQARMMISDVSDPAARREKLKLAYFTDEQITVILR